MLADYYRRIVDIKYQKFFFAVFQKDFFNRKIEIRVGGIRIYAKHLVLNLFTMTHLFSPDLPHFRRVGGRIEVGLKYGLFINIVSSVILYS